MTKLVIHIFHDDPTSLAFAGDLAERVRQVKAERGVDLEVYVSGPARQALLNPAFTAFNDRIEVLTCDGIPVGACLSTVGAQDAADALKARGLRDEDARDAFVRFALEGATVVSF
ncbi:hypothetical protein VH569_28005 [Azospirillum sp. 11R-A]|uniref:hypothetical protein n=1 Tax=Azospirillum sp. 11R-A TaxID=3111634 RepID=UPI003C257B62